MPRFALLPEYSGTNTEGTGISGVNFRFYMTFVGCASPSEFAEIFCETIIDISLTTSFFGSWSSRCQDHGQDLSLHLGLLGVNSVDGTESYQ